jgi:hypothetical protein
MTGRFFLHLSAWRSLPLDLQPPEAVWLAPWREEKGVKRRFLIARVEE